MPVWRRCPAVVQDSQRVGAQDRRDSGAPLVPASWGTPQHLPWSRQLSPSTLVAWRVTIRSSCRGESAGGSRPTSPSRRRPQDHRILDRPCGIAGERHPAPSARELIEPWSVQRLDPPVLGLWRRTAQVEPPAAVSRHDHRSLNEAAPKMSRWTSQTEENQYAVGRAGDHDTDPSALVERAAHPIGQPENAVDQHAARRPGPVARTRRRCGDHHVGAGITRLADPCAPPWKCPRRNVDFGTRNLPRRGPRAEGEATQGGRLGLRHRSGRPPRPHTLRMSSRAP